MSGNAFLVRVRFALAVALAAGTAVAAAQTTAAADWPKGPVHVVVPSQPPQFTLPLPHAFGT